MMYETPIMEVIDLENDIRTSDVIVGSNIEPGYNNLDVKNPWD